MVTSLNKVCGHLTETTLWRAELDRPKEVVSLLKMLANSVDLVDKILNTDYAKLSELLFDDRVVCDGNALSVQFSIATLVDQLTDALQIRITKTTTKKRI